VTGLVVPDLPGGVGSLPLPLAEPGPPAARAVPAGGPGVAAPSLAGHNFLLALSGAGGAPAAAPAGLAVSSGGSPALPFDLLSPGPASSIGLADTPLPLLAEPAFPKGLDVLSGGAGGPRSVELLPAKDQKDGAVPPLPTFTPGTAAARAGRNPPPDATRPRTLFVIGLDDPAPGSPVPAGGGPPGDGGGPGLQAPPPPAVGPLPLSGKDGPGDGQVPRDGPGPVRPPRRGAAAAGWAVALPFVERLASGARGRRPSPRRRPGRPGRGKRTP
jgi:hypothetical protein